MPSTPDFVGDKPEDAITHSPASRARDRESLRRRIEVGGLVHVGPNEVVALLDEIEYINKVRVSGAEASLGIAQIVRERNKEIADLIALLERCATALVWCAGTKAFGEEGELRKGWERVCLPVITDLLKTSPVIPLPGQ